MEMQKENQKRREREFYECILDILNHPVVKQMKKYPQHGNTNCYKHCLYVAYYSFLICNSLGLKAEDAARAGMLHDLFLYDWHTHAKETGIHFHGLTHPKEALKNADENFELSNLEKDIILKHMWPLTITPPQYPESFVICFVDKFCSVCEIFDSIVYK